tara:strand:- start:522 stop:1226 length:705 start_codon:yes stop_codon:yes gene_type:complete
MNKESNFEIFLLIGNEKFHIFVSNINGDKTFYEQEKFIENISYDSHLLQLEEFLNNNILKIEKKIQNFIKNIHIILDTDKFFPIQISIKNNNNGNILTKKNLIYPLNEAKALCDKTIGKKKIIHMFIDNYQINGNNFSKLPNHLSCYYFYLDIKFLCLSHEYLSNLENALKKHQISIDRILDFHYVNNFFRDKDLNLFQKTKQIVDGCNGNEVKFTDKIRENRGFFEKIFNFFN